MLAEVLAQAGVDVQGRLADRPPQPLPRDVEARRGFSRIVVSAIGAPNLAVNLVWRG
jgi:hypothetical protein